VAKKNSVIESELPPEPPLGTGKYATLNFHDVRNYRNIQRSEFSSGPVQSKHNSTAVLETESVNESKNTPKAHKGDAHKVRNPDPIEGKRLEFSDFDIKSPPPPDHCPSLVLGKSKKSLLENANLSKKYDLPDFLTTRKKGTDILKGLISNYFDK